MAVHVAAADDVLGGDKVCVVFSNRVSWVGSGIEYMYIIIVSVPENFSINL